MFGSHIASSAGNQCALASRLADTSSARSRRRPPPARRRSWRACCPCCSTRPGSSASRPKTRHATGKANFWWMYMISLCGDRFVRSFLRDLGPELGDGHLRRAVDDLGLREDVGRVEGDRLGREPLDLVAGRVLRVGPVLAAVPERQVDASLGFWSMTSRPRRGDQELRLLRVAAVGDEDVAPAAAVRLATSRA